MLARTATALLLSTGLLALAACGSDSDSGSSSSSSSSSSTSAATAASCAKDQLSLHTAGRLTVATDKPAFPPYFIDGKPENGKGFESAVAYAIAGRLGFANDEVKWVTEPFNSSYAPGPKSFDFDVNEISITPKRAKRVSFSRPYYTAPQAVILPKGSSLSVTSLSSLQDEQLGVQIGTTSLDAVQQVIKPSKQPKVFNDSNDVVTALKQGQVDAVVTDLPTALYITAAQAPGAKVAGQFPAPGGDRWGALLQKGSKLTPCVDRALTQLEQSGQLKRLTEKWMSTSTGAPTLQ
jgi:polar amino acid transport system substrate-binding protein